LFSVSPFHRGYTDPSVQMFGGPGWCWLWYSCWYMEHSVHGKN